MKLRYQNQAMSKAGITMSTEIVRSDDIKKPKNVLRKYSLLPLPAASCIFFSINFHIQTEIKIS